MPSNVVENDASFMNDVVSSDKSVPTELSKHSLGTVSRVPVIVAAVLTPNRVAMPLGSGLVGVKHLALGLVRICVGSRVRRDGPMLAIVMLVLLIEEALIASLTRTGAVIVSFSDVASTEYICKDAL